MKKGARIATHKSRHDGVEIQDYHNPHSAVAPDLTVAQIMPRVIMECAISRNGEQTCMRRVIVAKIARETIGAQVTDQTNLRELMTKIFAHTGCTSEQCVLEVAKKMRVVSAEEAGVERMLAFKQRGPTDITLLSDGVIDAQLYAWMYQFPQFWAYNFHMLNWREKCIREGSVRAHPDTFATINWAQLYAGEIPNPVGMEMTTAANQMIAQKRATGIRCSAVVVNGDYYDGAGKHWMAIFVDARATGDAPEWTIEFFNSAAIHPESEWIDWMAKTYRELQSANPRARVRRIWVDRLWHQHTKSECGPYSLFYIWARLNDVPAQYFIDNVVPDQIVLEFRQHLFGEEAVGKPFNFAEYAKRVHVRWDSESSHS